MIEGWARNGLTDEQIAHNMGINVATLYRWKEAHCEICNALKKGKEVVDLMVENALFKSAVGEVRKVKKPIKLKREKQVQGKGKVVEEYIEYVEEEVFVPPQVLAQIFWLKNRKPSDWRDKPEGENFNEALQEMLKGINKMNQVVSQPVQNRNIEDLE